MLEVNNLTTERIDKVFLKRIAEKVLTAEKKEKNKNIPCFNWRKGNKKNK